MTTDAITDAQALDLFMATHTGSCEHLRCLSCLAAAEIRRLETRHAELLGKMSALVVSWRYLADTCFQYPGWPVCWQKCADELYVLTGFKSR